MEGKKETFTSRFGLIAATIGMAIGAGNIWRFPRLAGQYGGSFLIPWFIFLLLWSIPLLIVEFSIGKKTKQGVIASFQQAMGEKYIWMGFFVAFCTSAILFYYSVVCGWSLKYFVMSIDHSIFEVDQAVYWDSYTKSIFQPLLYHLISLGIGAFIIYKGVIRGIEKFSKIVVPALFLLLLLAAGKAISLAGARIGVDYFFGFEWDALKNHKIWLDGLSQSAWSTGAGWGLLLTYAIYARKNEKIIANSFWAGIGNNSASIVAGLAIIPTVFALSQDIVSAQQALGSGNQGLAFIVIPQLFQKITAGQFFITVFFLALFFAALSSLISMIEMAARILMDFGFDRKKAVIWISVFTAVLGAPSAVSLDFFNNQDWVWGLGLMLSGAFFTILVIRIGVTRFVSQWLRPAKGEKIITAIFQFLFYFLMPIEFLGMLGWWLWQSLQWYPDNWWNPVEIYSLGSTLLQWSIVCVAGYLLASKMKTALSNHSNGD